MRPRFDLSGQQFGRLTALRPSEKNDGRKAWVCLCQCGQETEIRGANLRSGKTMSCGCLKSENLAAGLGKRHGMYRTKTHKTWSSMIERCTQRGNPAYHRYGARGIIVCDRWMQFENFLADMGHRPEGTSLDRIDNDKGYEPGNCRWATSMQQQNNLSTNRRVQYQGREYTARELSDLTGVPYGRLRERLFKRGWEVERAITEPAQIKVDRFNAMGKAA